MPAVSESLRSGRSLLEIEDRRQFHPGVAPSRTLRQLARVTMKPPAVSKRRSRKGPALFSGPEVHVFRVPKSTAVCIRRFIRKEVIHAKGIAGSRVKKPRRNSKSSISCKRR